MGKGGPLTWRDRSASRYVHREARLADGTDVSIWAFPRGIRPAGSWSVSVAPWPVWAIRIVFENVRYRVKYRGAWVVEVRNPTSDLPLDDRNVPSRADAMNLLEAARRRADTVALDRVGKLLGA